MRRTLCAVAPALIVAFSTLLAGPQAAASGWYNMPTSLSQCLGVGVGPGYHAPLVLGPALKAKIASQRVVRLPGPLGPPPPMVEPMRYGAGMRYGVSRPAPTAYGEVVTPTFAPPMSAGPELIPTPAW